MTITHVTPRETELQAEVTRLGAELAGLWAKLAALEAQKPVAMVHAKHPSTGGVWIRHMGVLKPDDNLYLAAGAKGNQVEQSCAGYGNHAPGDAPCNVCGFTGRKT